MSIEILVFIRWCKSTKNIYDKIYEIQKESINYKYIVGIYALRSIIDRLDPKKREGIIKIIFKNTYQKNYLIY